MEPDELRRRELPRLVILRLQAAGIGEPGKLSTGPSDDPDFDVDVRILPFDEETVERCRQAISDIRIRVFPGREGGWVRG